MGDKLPGPMKKAFDKALELAAFAPLLPLAEKLKSKDLQGALHMVMSSPMMKAVSAINTELPRTVLKRLLQNDAVTKAIQQAMARLPQQLHSPFTMLQNLSQDLDGDIEVLTRFQDVVESFKILDAANCDFKFPDDLIRNVNPVQALASIAHTLPGPLRSVFNKGLEAAAFAPLLPIVEKVKQKDLHGALSMMVSMPMLEASQCLDAEMPRNLLKSILGSAAVVSNIENAMARMPTQLHPPLEMLQEFSKHLDVEMEELMENCSNIIENFISYAQVYADPKVNFKFPHELMEGVDAASVLQLLSDKVPAPMDTAFIAAVGGILLFIALASCHEITQCSCPIHHLTFAVSTRRRKGQGDTRFCT